MKIKFAFLFVLCLVPLTVFCQGRPNPVIIDGDQITYLQEEGKILATGGVKMKYKGVEISCDEVEFDANANIAHINGNVRIKRENITLYGSNIIFNFNTNNAQIQNMRLEDPPIYGEAKNAEKIGNEKYVLNDGYATTCELADPHYRLTTKSITIYPGDRVEARNMVLRVGKIPIFYIPYFSQSLKDKSLPVEFIPGKNSDWGYYLLTYWPYRLGEENKGKIHFGWYEERGLTAGVIHTMESKNFGKALVKYYLLEDELYKADKRNEFLDKYPERAGIPAKFLEDDRYRGQFSYSWNPQPSLSIKGEFHKFSDEFFMKDFFEREYDVEPNPLSYIIINKSFANSSLSLLGQKRVNLFRAETEYLPQLQYEFYRQNIGSSKFYFESNNKIANLNITNVNSRSKDNTVRFHSFNSVSYINRIGWLNFNPFSGAYTTFYSKNKFGDENILRIAPKMGVTLSTKLYKFFNSGWSLFGERIDEARHVITPEVTYSYIHDPTVSSGNLFPFDSDDSLAREEKIIFTLKNKLQVKNEKRTWDFIFFSPSVEYRLKEEGKGSYFDNVKADLEIYPREGLSLTANTKYDVNTRRVAEVNVDITISGKTKMIENGEEVEKQKYSLTLGHRYVHSDDTQGTLAFTYQLTPKFQFKNYMRYEYNREDLLEQQYSIRTDLHCWWMDVGVNIDRHQNGGKDLTFWVGFTIKAFPEIHVDFDHGYSGAKGSY
ncbi:MAG: hypothetical protein NG737_05180 [Omnitrophica bacterium]|nr:hypothetical protein [Candidatus Omnitrophota bacterium]